MIKEIGKTLMESASRLYRETTLFLKILKKSDDAIKSVGSMGFRCAVIPREARRRHWNRSGRNKRRSDGHVAMAATLRGANVLSRRVHWKWKSRSAGPLFGRVTNRRRRPREIAREFSSRRPPTDRKTLLPSSQSALYFIFIFFLWFFKSFLPALRLFHRERIRDSASNNAHCN